MFRNYLVDCEENKNTYYKVGRSLESCLDKIDLNVPIKIIPKENTSCFIEFNDTYDLDDTSGCSGWQTKSVLIDIFKKMITVTYPTYCKEGFSFGSASFYLDRGDIDSNSFLDECVEVMGADSIGSLGKSKRVISLAMKVFMYICSNEPQLLAEPAPENKRKNTSKRVNFYKKYNMFSTIIVGFDFHGRSSHVDSWGVNGHFRWQPCGKGYNSVKLIWIDEHTRQHKGE